jgi:hypothetical protein
MRFECNTLSRELVQAINEIVMANELCSKI